MITCITITGFRPEAFKLCCAYMDRQFCHEDVQWIVIDDSIVNGVGENSTANILRTLKNPRLKPELYAGPRQWAAGINTHRANLEMAIPLVRGDKVFIIEDDDWYTDTYLNTYCGFLDHHADVVGEANTKYYNVLIPGGIELGNAKHSSLCQTAFNSHLLPMFSAAVNSGQLYIDISFWDKIHANRVPRVLLWEQNLCVGIKGMPGRENLSEGHKRRGYTLDPKLDKLRAWIGPDAELYKPFVRKYNAKPQNQQASKGQLLGGQKRDPARSAFQTLVRNAKAKSSQASKSQNQKVR